MISKHRIAILMLALGMLILGCVFIAQAQTNATLTVTPPAHEVIAVDSAEAALIAMLHFMGFSPQSLTLMAIVIHLVARGIRNTALDGKLSSEVGSISNAIAVVGGKPLPKAAIALLGNVEKVEQKPI